MSSLSGLEAGPVTDASRSAVTQTAPVWPADSRPAVFDAEQIAACLRQVREPVHIVCPADGGPRGLALGHQVAALDATGYHRLGTLPPLYPEWLGDRDFGAVHGVRFPYVAGEMARGIATTKMVVAMARAEMLGVYGAAGLDVATIDRAVSELSGALGSYGLWGVNLIHSPAEPALEAQTAGLLLRRGVPIISASAYMDITPPLARCAAAGLRLDPAGRIVRPVRIFAKVSRPEVAEKFMAPAPEGLLTALVARGELTQEEARLAARVPVAEDVTVEADSGGHTDNQPLGAMLPAILALRDAAVARYGYTRRIRVGAAGGLGSPHAVAGAFALGAGYVLTGSVNQLAVESGICDDARALLAQADLADVMMAPAADMFELGVQVQVLRRGTMFGPRARRLYEVYREYASVEELPASVRGALEREVLHASLDEVWAQTVGFWQLRDPAQLARAAGDARHRMALIFRWYLGNSSRWAVEGDTSRRTDYQLWAGPAAGAFNRWTAGSFLADPGERTVTQIALNLLEGAAVITRAHQARTYGVAVPSQAFTFAPRRLR
jgi:trans-AT polyketide synthase/acyltransferase/oxidoreductase domain-containing protein